MSLINDQYAIPQAIEAAAKVLSAQSAKRGVAPAWLQGVLAPEAIPAAPGSQRDRARSTLKWMQSLMLIDEKDGIVSLAERVPSPLDSREAFVRHVRRAAIKHDTDIPAALSWLMHWDTSRLGNLSWQKAEWHGQRSLGNGTALNDTRFGMIGHWSTWLGFAFRDGQGIIPDASGSFRDTVLPDLPPDEQVPVAEFIKTVEREFSVPNGWTLQGDAQNGSIRLSPGLQGTLRHMWHTGELQFRSRSDAGFSIVLPWLTGTSTFATHVVRVGAQ